MDNGIINLINEAVFISFLMFLFFMSFSSGEKDYSTL